VTPKTEIGADDGLGRLFALKAVKLADLPVGANATLKLSVDGKQVQTVVAEGSSAGGTVKSVDANKKQITLTTREARRDNAGEEKTFDVAGEAEIVFDDGRGRLFSAKEGTLADVPAGSVVALRLTPDQRTALIVRAEGPNVSGAVKGVDAAKGTITLVTRRGR